MLLTRSLQRRIVVAASAALGFVLLYESPVLDSEYLQVRFLRGGQAADPGEPQPEEVASTAPGVRLRFRATAYCKGTTTASGTAIRTGIAAADPALLPVGSVIQVGSLGPRYDGIYTIMDTGPKVRGRQIDVYMWNCNEALAFGRRTLTVNVLRLGWNPRVSTPERVAPEFQRLERELSRPRELEPEREAGPEAEAEREPAPAAAPAPDATEADTSVPVDQPEPPETQ